MYEISQMDNTLGFVVWGTELFKIDPFIPHGLVTSKLASKIWVIISSGDSLAPDEWRYQAITWSYADLSEMGIS